MNLLELRILGAVGLIAALWIGYGVFHHHVWREGFDACQAAQIKAIEKGEKQHEKNSDKNAKLSDDLARRKYCSRVRDASLSVCLHDFAPIRP